MKTLIIKRLQEAKEFYITINPDEYLWAWPMLVLGALQLLAGAASKNKRPKQKVSEATKEAENIARGLSQQTTDPLLANQLSEIDQSRAQGIDALKRTVKDPGQLLSGVSKLVSGSNRASRGAMMDFAGRQQGRTSQFLSQLARTANEQRAAFQFNEAQKYAEQSARKSALIEGGIQNLAGGYNEMQLSKQNQALKDYVYGGSYSKPVAQNNAGTNYNLALADRNIRNDLARTASFVG